MTVDFSLLAGFVTVRDIVRDTIVKSLYLLFHYLHQDADCER